MAITSLLAGLFFLTSCEQKSSPAQATTTQSTGARQDDTTAAHQEPALPATASTTFSEVAPEARTQAAKLLGAYLNLKNSLVASDLKKTKQGAQQIVDVLAGFNAAGLPADQGAFYQEHTPMLKEDAEHILETGDVNHQRDHLEALSERTYALVKAFGANGAALHRQYCPMAFDNKGAHWLSETEPIRNPYFGEKMLSCGQTKETLGAKRSAAQ